MPAVRHEPPDAIGRIKLNGAPFPKACDELAVSDSPLPEVSFAHSGATDERFDIQEKVVMGRHDRMMWAAAQIVNGL